MVGKLTLLELNVDLPEFGVPEPSEESAAGAAADEGDTGSDAEPTGDGDRRSLAPLVGLAFLVALGYVARRALRSRRGTGEERASDAEIDGNGADSVEIAGH